jgi:hypothetical protein
MAGCLPDHMPLVLGAARAVMQPEFDLTEMQATTHDTAPLVIVNGPVRVGCGMASGFGALGPGNRSNASVGRALRLAMINIGGGRPGSSDMALFGHPGKFTMVIAEDEEHSPFPPLHVTRGYQALDSVVTVIGTSSPQSVIHVSDADDPDTPARLISCLAATFAAPGTNNINLRGGQAVVALNVDHAAELGSAGYTRADIAAGIQNHATMRLGDLREFNPVMSGRGDDNDVVHAFSSPDDILVLVAGGGGLYSVVFPTWCAGPHRNQAVSALVELDQTCEVPQPT